MITMGLFQFKRRHMKICFMPYDNKKVADQTMHVHSLISTFIVCCLVSIMPILFLNRKHTSLAQSRLVGDHLG